MNSNPVAWFEIYVNDMARARAFYETVLTLTLEPEDKMAGQEPKMWVFPGSAHAPGASGALVKMVGDDLETGGASTLVYFSCEDCDSVLARVPANGGRVIREKYSIGSYGFIALLDDTDGNRIGLHSMR